MRLKIGQTVKLALHAIDSAEDLDVCRMDFLKNSNASIAEWLTAPQLSPGFEVPTQEWTKQWTDADLYKKYGLTGSEIEFIEKIVRPMDLATREPDDTISEVDDDE